MKYIHFSFLLIIAFMFSSCYSNDKEVKQLEAKLLESKLGTIENQRLITQLEKKEVPKIPKKKVIPVSIKKQNFKNILVPIVTEVYNQLQQQYKKVKEDIAYNRNHDFIESLKIFYGVDNNEDLLLALKPHPISITLAQSAVESAWLTSRFTKVANNIFGVWSFRENEPRVAANDTRGDKVIYLRKYKNFKSAIFDYYKNLAKNGAYKEFREQRMVTNDPYVLVDYLTAYSEKREKYTKLLKRIIKRNNFDLYDTKKIQ